MQETETPNIRALKIKINKLAKIILDELSVNPSFCQKLEEMLIESSPMSSISVVKAPTAKKAKLVFNPVRYLQENSEEFLLKELDTKTETELKGIMRAEGLKKPKGVKIYGKEEIIKDIVNAAKQNLKQGEAFLK